MIVPKLSTLYKHTIERWKPIKTPIDFSKMVGHECPFCRDVNDECEKCRISNELCKDAAGTDIFERIYRSAGSSIHTILYENPKEFKKLLRKGKRLLKKEYKKALKNEHKNKKNQ